MNVLKLTTLKGDILYYPASTITAVGVSKTLAKTHIFIAQNEAGYFIDMDAEIFMQEMFQEADYTLVECNQIKV